MKLRLLGGLLALAAAAALLRTGPPLHASPVAPITSATDIDQQIGYTDVVAADDTFEPQVVTITVGSAVRWRNTGMHPHSTTSDNGYWSWGLVPGSTFSLRFLSAGTYGYHCIYHESLGMTGTIVVLPASGTPGTPYATPTGPTPPGPWPTPPPPPFPTSMPDDGEIVFDDTATSILEGQTDLYAVQPSGAGRRQLTNTTDMAEAQPSWSPDRQMVAYTATSMGTVATAWGIWVLDVATGERRQLTAGPDQYEPDWRPDGGAILFTNIVRSGNAVYAAELAVVAPDGTGYRPIVRLSGASGTIGNPTWSPDGTRIAFTVNLGSTGGEIYVANADGTNARRLLAHSGWDDIDPRWSPDGRYIAFVSGINRTVGPILHDVWLVDLTTGLAGTVARHPTWELRRPAWSPDGRTLVFTARYQDSPARWSMYTVPAVGGDVSGPISSGVEPDWSNSMIGGLPTPMPGATATESAPPTPATPPPFPTIEPEPTITGPTPTIPPAPTFPALTPPPEATPTIGAPPSTPTKDVPPTVIPTGNPVVGKVFLPVSYTGAFAELPPTR
ncbi:MAG: cupredoxin domain-containing protein [Ardenticatenales bacterium]